VTWRGYARQFRRISQNGELSVCPQFPAAIHEKFSTPSVAVIGITVGTLLGLLLGDSILVPITEVGSMASALGWLAACLSFWFLEPRLRMRIVTGLGISVSLLLLLMKLVPAFPGHFTPSEWIALAVWLLLGAALHRRPNLAPAEKNL
jgi:amino acid transporter